MPVPARDRNKEKSMLDNMKPINGAMLKKIMNSTKKPKKQYT